MASGTDSGSVTCSHHLVTCWKFMSAEKFGVMFRILRG